MKKKYDRIIKLIRAYNQGSISTEEHKELLRWVSLNKYNRAAFEKMTNAELLKQELEIFNRFDTEKSLTQFYRKYTKDQGPLAKPLFGPWLRMVAVAATIAAFIVSIWLSRPHHPNAGQDPTSAQYSKDIAPGKNTATLTLANGKTITLSDAKTGVVIDSSKLTYNDGSSILDSSLAGEVSSTFLTASTPRGGTYQFTLPDGTKVWLNAASTLKFPTTFAAVTQRKVILSGEAYFEVNKDKLHPFIVETNEQQVEVLGTHFNINSYTDEGKTNTTLLEGSVKVSSLQGSSSPVILKPNQEATLTANNIKVSEANIEETISWKNGYFRFNNENITSIMRKLSRWYNIEVQFNNPPSSEGFNGKISRFKNISQVLKMLEETNAVQFKVEGRKVSVSSK